MTSHTHTIMTASFPKHIQEAIEFCTRQYPDRIWMENSIKFHEKSGLVPILVEYNDYHIERIWYDFPQVVSATLTHKAER